MTETLLQTKLYIPLTRSNLVPRPQLLARLNAGLDGRLTLVSAPDGFGKPTLIVNWSQQLAESDAWCLASRDYIGIKKLINLALAHYSKADQPNIEEIKMAAEYEQVTEVLEKRFRFLAKRMKAAYDVKISRLS